MRKKLYSIKDMAQVIGTTPAALRMRISRGQLNLLPPSILIGKRRHFPVEMFDKWLIQNASSQKRIGRPKKIRSFGGSD